MLATIDRLADADLPVSSRQASELRQADWLICARGTGDEP
jgi:hypothetical protein